MTVINSPRPPTARSEGLPEIPEEGSPDTHEAGSQETSRPRSPTPSSLPTEYHQSFRTRRGPRPRNPVSGWQARNLSNILPTGSELPAQPARASRRPPPESWLARQASSQIFPVNPPRPAPNAPAGDTADVNNNLNSWVTPIVIGGRRRTGRWPWQATAQTSSIFLSEAENALPPPPPRPHSAQHKYPWQERAKKSVIFECLTGQNSGPTRKLRRTYEWDQRQSKLVTEAVQQKPTTSGKSQGLQNSSSTKTSQWPWKERANQSVVFRSPDKPTCPRPVNYNWDQRRSRFSVQLDPSAQFSKGSSYKDNFVKWQTVQDGKGMVKAAGKPCYLDDYTRDEKGKENQQEETISPGGGRRRFKAKASGSGEILALLAPPTKSAEELAKRSPSSSKLSSRSSASVKGGSRVKGETCLDIVPVGYHFSNHGSDTGRRKL